MNELDGFMHGWMDRMDGMDESMDGYRQKTKHALSHAIYTHIRPTHICMYSALLSRDGKYVIQLL